MRFPALVLAVCVLFPRLARAEDDKAPSTQVQRTALEWMQSSDPERRQAAYRSVHLFSKEALPSFTAALRKARQFHSKRLSEVLNDQGSNGNPYLKLEPLSEELGPERERIYALIKTDYKKDPTKVRMLRDEFEGIERLYQQATRVTETDPTAFDRKVDALSAILVEIGIEISHFEDDTIFDPDSTLEQLKEEALSESFDGDRYLQSRAGFTNLRKETEALAAAETANANCSWANSSQKSFATHLNRERAVMGLQPLYLEELLSKAATGHSADMKALGFFSHSSPVKNKRSPGDRARLAGFKGRWTGENIYKGSSSHVGAYNGWFASDGHRFIMFAQGPNLLGIGPVGNHWTLMTGRR